MSFPGRYSPNSCLENVFTISFYLVSLTSFVVSEFPSTQVLYYLSCTQPFTVLVLASIFGLQKRALFEFVVVFVHTKHPLVSYSDGFSLIKTNEVGIPIIWS